MYYIDMIETNTRPESVYWINTNEKPGRIERIRSALYHAIGKDYQTPIGDMPFTTHIPTDEIDAIEDEQLKSALIKQLDWAKRGEKYAIYPVATIESRKLVRTLAIPIGRSAVGMVTYK